MKGEKYNRNADTWSFGSLLYHVVTGERAYADYKEGAQVITAVYIDQVIPEYTPRDVGSPPKKKDRFNSFKALAYAHYGRSPCAALIYFFKRTYETGRCR